MQYMQFKYQEEYFVLAYFLKPKYCEKSNFISKCLIPLFFAYFYTCEYSLEFNNFYLNWSKPFSMLNLFSGCSPTATR